MKEMDLPVISLSACPNCGKKIFLNTETVYTFCYSCQSSFTVEVIGGTPTLKPTSPVLHKSIDRLVNLEYLINNTQSKMKTIQRDIRVYQILKIFSMIFILAGIWMLFYRTADNIQLGLMVIGISVFLFLLSFFIVSHSRKQLEKEQREQTRFRSEISSMEESIKALTNNL